MAQCVDRLSHLALFEYDVLSDYRIVASKRQLTATRQQKHTQHHSQSAAVGSSWCSVVAGGRVRLGVCAVVVAVY